MFPLFSLSCKLTAGKCFTELSSSFKGEVIVFNLEAAKPYSDLTFSGIMWVEMEILPHTEELIDGASW